LEPPTQNPWQDKEMMKRIFIVTIIIGSLLVACSQEEPDNTELDATPIIPAYAEAAPLYKETAEKLIASYSSDLKAELMDALKISDAAGVLKICGAVAPGIADSAAGSGWTIGRVSDKYRNPDNRADTTELAILRRFDDSTAIGFTHIWTETDSGAVYRYYKPILTGQFCLKCHGDMQTLGQGVYKKLKKLYPLDKATGYKAGQLRGMFVVEANWPEGDAFMEHVLFDSLLPTDSVTLFDSLSLTDSL
jgi:hypothetical protein